MARRTKAIVLARTELVEPPTAGRALDDPRVVALSERFLELKRDLFRDSVDTIIEMGDLLDQGRKVLHGHYRRWLDRLGLPAATARRYIELFELSRQAPSVIEKWKELGPSKLYKVARVEPAGRREILKERERGKLLAMNDGQFAERTAPYLRRIRKVTPEMRAHGLRMKVQAWTKALTKSKVGRLSDEEMRRGLQGELRALAELAKRVAGSV